VIYGGKSLALQEVGFRIWWSYLQRPRLIRLPSLSNRVVGVGCRGTFTKFKLVEIHKCKVLTRNKLVTVKFLKLVLASITVWNTSPSFPILSARCKFWYSCIGCINTRRNLHEDRRETDRVGLFETSMQRWSVRKLQGIRSQPERQRPEGRKLSADNATRMRATCWPDKLMACCGTDDDKSRSKICTNNK
jgi:hypothetical protein